MQSATIISHNAAWFLGFPQPSTQPDDYNENLLARLAALYKSYTPDVVCLQEVQSPEACLAMGEALGMPGVYTPGAALEQYGGAIYANTLPTVTDSQPLARKPQRFWQKAVASLGGQSLTICNLHLASDKHLDKETAAISRITDIDGILRVAPKPDIIVGDFNEPPALPSGKRLSAAGFIDIGGLAPDPPETTGKNKRRSDLIWATREWANRIDGLDYYPYTGMTNDEGGYLSDHYLLVLRLAW
jgi:hypothetical protein